MLRVVEIKRTMTMRFYMLRIMPVGLFMALTLHFGNTVYLYLTVSFIQMLKVICIGLPTWEASSAVRFLLPQPPWY